MANGKKSEARKITTAERRKQVLDLRKRGMSLRNIAEILGVTHTTVRNDIKKSLESLDGKNTETAKELRRLIELRLTEALGAIVGSVEAGDLGAIDRWLRLNQELAKLFGAYEPEKIIISVLFEFFQNEEFIDAWQKLEADGENMSALAARFNEFVIQAAKERAQK